MKREFNTVQLIKKKRDAKPLDAGEISYLIDSYSKDKLPDYQMSAFLMAGYLNGLNAEESSALTNAMLKSGKRIDLSSVPGKKVDKHSTGGVGDKLSLILAPIATSCGVTVPMISGRGLGHTGGTLDKLESIKGFDVNLSIPVFKKYIVRHGLAMAGQTEEIAPADKRIYALRDVTATVEFIPYIASSIMSKKLAEDIDGLVLDVKYGSGAFMQTPEEALELAQTLVEIGDSFGTETVAYLTAMNQPLGKTVGNWLEALEAFEALEGRGADDVMEISHLLAGTMIYLGDKAADIEEGIEKSRQAIASGRARDRWLKVVREQKGDVRLLTQPDRYPAANETYRFKANKKGYITRMDAYKIGLAAVELGAGRKLKEDRIDPAAGVRLHKKMGETIEKGATLATLYAESVEGITSARSFLEEAFYIAEEPVTPPALIRCRVDKNGVTPGY